MIPEKEHGNTYLKCLFSLLSLVLLVSSPQLFFSVLEGGNETKVCAMFSGTLLDREVSIFFSVQSLSATGKVNMFICICC